MPKTINGDNSAELLINHDPFSIIFQIRDGKDIINGFGGNGVLWGRNGDNTLKGGTGNDTVIGEDDNDLIYGDADGSYYS